MKTLILYATKYGTTKELANRIAQRLEDADVYNLKDHFILNNYEMIIVGSSIYAGSFRSEAKKFLQDYSETLKEKTLGLFISSMRNTEMENIFSLNVPKDILESAKATAHLGGIFDPKKASLPDRIIIKLVSKKLDYTNTISDTAIDSFIDRLTTE